MVKAYKIHLTQANSTSPSVYVVWSTVSAGVENRVRQHPPVTLATHYDITKAYPPGHLMTIPGGCNHNEVGKPWSPLRVKDLMHPPQNWISDDGCFWRFDSNGEGTGPLGGVDPNGTIMAASPVLSYPPDILTLDSSWKNCASDAYNWGNYAPPRPLTPIGTMSYLSMGGPRYLSSITDCPYCLGPGFHSSVTAVMPPPAPQIISSIGGPPPSVTETLAAAFFHVSVPAIAANNFPGGVQASKTYFGGVAAQPTETSSPADPPAETYVALHGDGDDPVSFLFGPRPDPPASEGQREQMALTKLAAIAAAASYQDHGQPKAGMTDADHPVNAGAMDLTSLNDLPTISGQQIEPGPEGAILVGGSTFSEGQQATLDNTFISVGHGMILVGTKTYRKPTATDPTAVSPPSYQDVIIDGKSMTLATLPTGLLPDLAVADVPAGFQTTILGVPASVGSDIVVFGKSTYALPLPTNAAISRASNAAVIFDDVTLTQGQHTTISGTAVSVNGNFVVIDGRTYDLPLPTHPAVSHASNGAIDFDGVTLTQGQQTTISSTAVSVNSNIIIIGGKIHDLPLPTDSAVSLASDGEILFDGVTLTEGEQTTVSGTAVSVGTGIIVVGGTAYALPMATDASKAGLGAVVASMYAYNGKANSTSGAFGSTQSNGTSPVDLASFTGSAQRTLHRTKELWIALLFSTMFCFILH